MDKSKNIRVFKIAYLPLAEEQLSDLCQTDMFGFILMVKLVCKQNNLDIYNFSEFRIAVEILKMQTSYN
jgi:hypothetical protein